VEELVGDFVTQGRKYRIPKAADVARNLHKDVWFSVSQFDVAYATSRFMSPVPS
jgi:hypothetical protein